MPLNPRRETLDHYLKFRRFHPAVYLWIMNLPEDQRSEFFTEIESWGSANSIGLSDSLILISIYENILGTAQTHPNSIAYSWDALNVHNGDYIVASGNREYKYRIHTVLAGPLKNKRIIKYKDPFESNYKGFAFLTKCGGIKIWERFRADENKRYVTVAKRNINSRLPATTIRCIFCNDTANRSIGSGTCACNVCYGMTEQTPDSGYTMEIQANRMRFTPLGENDGELLVDNTRAYEGNQFLTSRPYTTQINPSQEYIQGYNVRSTVRSAREQELLHNEYAAQLTQTWPTPPDWEDWEVQSSQSSHRPETGAQRYFRERNQTEPENTETSIPMCEVTGKYVQ